MSKKVNLHHHLIPEFNTINKERYKVRSSKSNHNHSIKINREGYDENKINEI